MAVGDIYTVFLSARVEQTEGDDCPWEEVAAMMAKNASGKKRKGNARFVAIAEVDTTAEIET